MLRTTTTTIKNLGWTLGKLEGKESDNAIHRPFHPTLSLASAAAIGMKAPMPCRL